MLNCYVFAAGNGLRLRPLTDNFQKCLLPVGGKPMLKWWLDSIFVSSEFANVFVNVHYCARQVEAWLVNYICETGFIPKTIDESKKLLGTAGTLHWHGDTENEFMSVYSDTWSEKIHQKSYLNDLVYRWNQQPKSVIAGIVCFNLSDDSSAGAVKIDPKTMTVTGFSEKSSAGDYGWAGILFGRPQFYDLIRDGDFDIALDILPRMEGRMRVISFIDAYDIGRGVDRYAELDQRLRQTAKH